MRWTLLVVVWAAPVRAQAPQSADMWRVATATLAAPAALQWGPTGAFWNPAPRVSTGSTRVGVQVLQTPEALALSGILAGISHQANEAVLVGAIAPVDDGHTRVPRRHPSGAIARMAHDENIGVGSTDNADGIGE